MPDKAKEWTLEEFFGAVDSSDKEVVATIICGT